MSTTKFVKLIKLNTYSDISFLESLLDTTSISYYFKKTGWYAGIPVYLMVEESFLEEAREILKDFTLHQE